MSVGSPASSPARHVAASATVRAAATAQVARQPMRAAAAPALAVTAVAAGDELRLDLRDIPPIEASMDVEGFKPSILSRLFDLFAPLQRS